MVFACKALKSLKLVFLWKSQTPTNRETEKPRVL